MRLFAWLAVFAFVFAIIFWFLAGKLAGDVEITTLFGFLCLALHLALGDRLIAYWDARRPSA
jgi:hypothetical protein